MYFTTRTRLLAVVLVLAPASCSSKSRTGEPDAAADPVTEPDGTVDPDEDPDVTDEPELDPEPDAAVDVEDADSEDVDDEDGPLTADECFAGGFVTPPPIGPDYDQFHPVMGTHCLGTNHQDIRGVQRVVFLGDSVTVGTPPTTSADYYRNQLAHALASRFGLAPPGILWQNVNILDGTTYVRSSGDFASCAKWGARADDLLRDNTQIEDCFPVEERYKTTLVIVTVGGNDISAITQAGIDGAPIDDTWAMTREFVQLLRDAVQWFFEVPDRFPGGVFVVFGNMFEFTDGTGDVTACPAAGLAGFGAAWDDPDALADMVIWANEQYLKIAVDTGTDMIFMLEHFCGHGFNHDDPASPCYRGPGTDRWFDISCIHPNPAGHTQLSRMFTAVVDE